MRFSKNLVLSLILIISLFSCERYIGYGVVMLPGEENNLESGSLIKITKESRIREAWVYNTPTEEHNEIKKWRVVYYNKQEDAQNYIDNYQEYKDYFVIVNRSSHTMRLRPDTSTKQVYRLKKDQKVKVIGRSKDIEKHGSFEGYWWNLITDDGVKGWSFDSYLSVYNKDEVIHSNVSPDGPEIHDFFKNVWRPKYFWEMKKSRNIDLEKFQTKFKMTPDLDNKELTISLPDNYVTYKFTEFKKTGENNYNLVGTPVQLDFSYKGTVIVIYSVDSKSYENDFIYLKDSEVNEIINTELTTRKIKFSEFLFEGPTFNSKAYGEITFLDDNKFIWSNKQNLINKQLLTNNALSEGTVSFNTFLGQELKGQYDGIISFDFGDRQELTFLYTFENSGIRFLYVPSTNIIDKVVESDDFYTPIQLFFTGQQ